MEDGVLPKVVAAQDDQAAVGVPEHLVGRLRTVGGHSWPQPARTKPTFRDQDNRSLVSGEVDQPIQ